MSVNMVRVLLAGGPLIAAAGFLAVRSANRERRVGRQPAVYLWPVGWLVGVFGLFVTVVVWYPLSVFASIVVVPLVVLATVVMVAWRARLRHVIRMRADAGASGTVPP